MTDSRLRKSRAAVASSPEVEAAAEELLRKGNAVDAAVAGVFAACALSPGVLLGPVQILIGGGGVGLRALDGRIRQPGIGAPRPRGFQSDEEVPDAAKVGVPWLPATLSVAVATAGTATFAQVLAPALALAKGSPRHDVLAKIASRGPRAVEERPLGAELLALCGRPAGGLLTSDDLSSQRPEVHAASRHVLGGSSGGRASRGPSPRGAASSSASRKGGGAAAGEGESGPRVIIELPWANDDGGMPVPPAGRVEVATTRAVACVDRFGAFAVACWDEGIDGLTIAELGLRAPFFAEPVLRGATRVRPGDARPAAAPVALVGTDAGPEFAFAAFGAGDAYDVLRGAIRSVIEENRIEAHGDARLVAVSHIANVCSVFRS
ncbi:MAG: gamma-glutamyltranspeptidase / glutathione hydrolase [Myxococcales bacterium]|nr:gamma-glutamyltranspeptidase / glutathione hydrolase [Myxococcales bacterium]